MGEPDRADAPLGREYDAKAAGYFGNRRDDMLAYVPLPCARFLDVGCGEGAFAARLKSETGAEAWGVEPHAPAVRVARQVLDRVVEGSFARGLALPPAYFDCVTFLDVLEHMVDPFDALRYARELLQPRGTVVTSIPNVRNFTVVYDLVFNGNWRYQDSGIMDRTHLRFFTRRSIRETFEDAGFEVVRLEGIRPFYNRKFAILRRLLWGRIDDMQFPQFAVVARPKVR